MDAASIKRYASSQARPCQYCGETYNLKGIGAHEKACARKVATQKSDKEYERILEKKAKRKNGEWFMCILEYLILIFRV